MDELNEKENSRLEDFGAALTENPEGRIYTLTIIGQVEGHQVLPETCKTTKYEHILPLLASIEESNEIDGLLLLLNTVGGDIEAGLAIAEMISGMKKPPFRWYWEAVIPLAFHWPFAPKNPSLPLPRP